MRVYTAHIHARKPPVLVKEGFTWGGFLFGPLWLLAEGAWIAGVIALALLAALCVAAPPPLRPSLGFGLFLLTGLFGTDLRRWGLALGGFRLAHVVAGRTQDEAFVRLLSARPLLTGGRRMMRVAVVDYGSGNLTSAARALVRAAGQAGIAADVSVTADPAQVAAADRVVLPGQGAFADCAAGLAAVDGMRHAIERSGASGRPFLGICVGMQLMAERGLEHGTTPGFGWVGGDVAEMAAPGLRLPQMGWNALDFEPGSHPLLDGLQPGDDVYFVHSYALRGTRPGEVVATTQYGEPVPAMVAAGNRAGTQFHVEKSQTVGLRILANFLRWAP